MYLRTDEESEASEGLRMVSQFADKLECDLRLWRWVIIALHNAVQGFMVLSLRHGNGLAALTKESMSAWLEALDKGGPYPEEKLDTYLNLYKKVKSKGYGDIGGNGLFVPKGTQGKSIKALNMIRNDFIHFTPKGWSLEVDGLPCICLDSIALIEFLGWNTRNINWHEPSYQIQSKLCCNKFREQMKHIKEIYKKM